MRKLITTAALAASLAIGASATDFATCKQSLDTRTENAVFKFGDYWKTAPINTDKEAYVNACRTILDKISGVDYSLSFKTKEGIEFRASADKFCSAWNNYMVHVSDKSKQDKDFLKNFTYFNLARLQESNETQAKIQGAKSGDMKTAFGLIKAQVVDHTLNMSERELNRKDWTNYLFSSTNWGKWIFNPNVSKGSDYYDSTDYREFIVKVSINDFKGADQIINDYQEDRKYIESMNHYICYVDSLK